MGDGRYYTYDQFFQILYFTVLSASLLFLIIEIQLKARYKINTSTMVKILMSLLAYSVVAFIRTVTYGPGWALKLARLEQVIISLVFVFIFTYYIDGMIDRFKKSKTDNMDIKKVDHGKDKKRSRLIESSVVVITIILLLVSYDWYDRFDFKVLEFSFYYQIFVFLMLIVAVLLIVSYTFMVCKQFAGIKCHQAALVMVATIGFSLSYELYVRHTELIWCFYFGIGLLLFMFWLIFFKYMPEEKTPVGYQGLVNRLVDTFVIVSAEREILHVSETHVSKFLNKEGMVDLRHLGDLINLDNKNTTKLENNTIQVNGYYKSDMITLNVCLKEINKEDKLIGYVIVIEDCTDLENLIEDLRIKKKQLTETENELLVLSKTAQVLSEENERNRLLMDVQNQLGHDLAALTKYLSNVLEHLDYKDIDKNEINNQLKTGVAIARENLSKIRGTVREYRESFDRKG